MRLLMSKKIKSQNLQKINLELVGLIVEECN